MGERVTSRLEEVRMLDAEHVMATYARQPAAFVRGEGATLYDADGEAYLDFLSGISVCNAGHCHPRVVEAVREQAGRLMHASNLYLTEPAARLAERLASSFGADAKVFFGNSGAEANEAALKLARKHRRGGEIVVLEGAFHGRTMGALSATPQETKQEPFAPLVPGFVVVPRADARHCHRIGYTCPSCGKPIYEESEQCPKCGTYLDGTDAPPQRRPLWIGLGVAAGANTASQ